MRVAGIYAHIEGALLELFWFHVGRGEDKLELLKAFAEQTIARTSDWNQATIRDEASTHGGGVEGKGCFACLSQDRKLYWHHILQVQHGGSNHPRNRVAICYQCHARIHPWLPPDRKGELRGGEWYSLAEVADGIAVQNQPSDAAPAAEEPESEPCR